MTTKLDPQASVQARDEAMQKVYDAADPQWLAVARAWVLHVAQKRGVHGTFCTDDVWAEGLVKPTEPRALGPIIMRLAREGFLQKSGVSQSSQVTRHAGMVTQWQWTGRSP